MPKGKGKKGGKGSAKPKTADDKDKALYVIEIGHLKEQLERCQLRCNDIEGNNTALKSELSTLEKEKNDVADFLQKSIVKREQKVETVMQRMDNQHQEAENEKKARQKEFDQQKLELENQVEGIRVERDELRKRMASLEEFRIQREQLMASMDALEKELALEKKDHVDDIHKLEMDALLEGKKRDQKLENHLKYIDEKVKDMVNAKVSDLTKNTFQENAEVSAKFIQLTEEAKVLTKTNCALRDQNSQLNVDVESLEQMLAELSRKGGIRKKVVAQLGEKCQQLHGEVKVFKQEYQHLQAKHKDCLHIIRTEMGALKKERKALIEELSQKQDEIAQMKVALKKERKRWMTWWRILSWKMPTVSKPEGNTDWSKYFEEDDEDDGMPREEQPQNEAGRGITERTDPSVPE